MIKKKGFTLIELLVVVAIIGLLATLSIIALNTARAKARDAKRVGDVKQMQTALELFYNDYGAYPTALNIASMTPFMSQVPVAPSPVDGSNCAGVTTYTYTQTGTSGSSYTLKYCLGGTTGNVPGNVISTATPAGIR